MRRINFISKHSLQLILGVLISLFLLTQTTVPSVEDAEAKQEQTESDNQQNEDQLTLSEAVTTSGPQINLGFQSFLLQEVTPDEETEGQGTLVERIISTSQKALRILFRSIISTNAP